MSSPDPQPNAAPLIDLNPPLTVPQSSDTADWRSHFEPTRRSNALSKLRETLATHPLFSGEERERERLKTFAVSYEKNVYMSATSEDDYEKKLSQYLDGALENIRRTVALKRNSTSGVVPPVGLEFSPLPPQGQDGASSTDTADGRSQVLRQNRMETLERHPLSSGEEGVERLKKFAMSYDKDKHTAAASKIDYAKTLSQNLKNSVENIKHKESLNREPTSGPVHPSPPTPQEINSGGSSSRYKEQLPNSTTRASLQLPLDLPEVHSEVAFVDVGASVYHVPAIAPPVKLTEFLNSHQNDEVVPVRFGDLKHLYRTFLNKDSLLSFFLTQSNETNALLMRYEQRVQRHRSQTSTPNVVSAFSTRRRDIQNNFSESSGTKRARLERELGLL